MTAVNVALRVEIGSNVMPSGTLRCLQALIFGFVMASTLANGTALGQGAPQSASSAGAAKAERHFEIGVEAVQADKWAAAREEFAAAYILSPQLKYLAALIKAEMATGRNREAAQHLATLLQHKAELDAKTLTEARKMLAEVKAALGTATIQVNVEGAAVLVDGVPVGSSPVEGDVFVDPGQRTFEAKKEGFAPARTVLDIKAGSEPSVALELRKVEPGVSWTLNKKLLYTGIGVTGGLALVGVGLGVIANNVIFAKAEAMQREDGCLGYNACKQEFNAWHDTRISLNYVAIGAYIGAGIAGAATLIYVLKAKKQDDGAVPRAALMVGPGGGALVFTGRF